MSNKENDVKSKSKCILDGLKKNNNPQNFYDIIKSQIEAKENQKPLNYEEKLALAIKSKEDYLKRSLTVEEIEHIKKFLNDPKNLKEYSKDSSIFLPSISNILKPVNNFDSTDINRLTELYTANRDPDSEEADEDLKQQAEKLTQILNERAIEEVTHKKNIEIMTKTLQEQLEETKTHTSQNEKTIELHTDELNQLKTVNESLDTQISQLKKSVELLSNQLEESKNQTFELIDVNELIKEQIKDIKTAATVTDNEAKRVNKKTNIALVIAALTLLATIIS